MQQRTERWAQKHGLALIPAPEHRSWTVACIKQGAFDVARLLAEVKQRGHTISNGYGDLKDISFRIGHMGDHTEAELESLLAAADEALAALAVKS